MRHFTSFLVFILALFDLAIYAAAETAAWQCGLRRAVAPAVAKPSANWAADYLKANKIPIVDFPVNMTADPAKIAEISLAFFVKSNVSMERFAQLAPYQGKAPRGNGNGSAVPRAFNCGQCFRGQRRRQWPRRQKICNGCTSVPDLSFNGCCNDHDRCYRRSFVASFTRRDSLQ
jgi:hypothetical protein